MMRLLSGLFIATIGFQGFTVAQNDTQCFVKGQCYEGQTVFAQSAGKFNL